MGKEVFMNLVEKLGILIPPMAFFVGFFLLLVLIEALIEYGVSLLLEIHYFRILTAKYPNTPLRIRKKVAKRKMIRKKDYLFCSILKALNLVE